MSLLELRVRDLGVIADLSLVFGEGMTVITGETGTGKTLVVDAIELLVGGKADPMVVRPGGEETLIEGRFSSSGVDVGADDDVVLSRAVPASGRSRAYIDGRMVAVGALATAGIDLVDLHGQHAHQGLLSPAAQRGALDAFAGIDQGPARAARERLASIDHQLAELGGDERARAREIDLLRFQRDEIAAAQLTDAEEDDGLESEESRLADASAHREAAGAALEALVGEGGAVDAVGTALSMTKGRVPLATIESRLREALADLDDIAHELRTCEETLEEDPARLAEVRARRNLLRELRRKYGSDLGEVMAFGVEVGERLVTLESHDAAVSRLGAEREEALTELATAHALIGTARRAASSAFAAAVEDRLRSLAMPRARLDVTVGEVDPGDDVVFLLGANPGEPALPLSKVASGGELSRTMLALRLVLAEATGDPDAGSRSTLIFDEVDAGVGGEAALAVGQALAALSATRQVIVVTHLAQVAAFADHHVVVQKDEEAGRTVATAGVVTGDDRLRELSRMLSGQPDSRAARRHAEDLLRTARGLAA